MSLIDAYPTQNEIDEGKLRPAVFKPMKSECDPVGVFFVTYSAGGEKIVFRYPFESPTATNRDKSDYSQNRFMMKDSLIVNYEVPKYNYSLGTKDGILTGYSDKVLANLLAPTKPDFCSQKFEVKINDIVFVGFPTVLATKDNLQPLGSRQTDVIFNVVFALRSWVSQDMIAVYQDVSRQLAVALCHEEHRVGYLSAQKQIMLSIQDDYSSNVEDDGPLNTTIFEKALEASSLAKSLCQVYEDICSTGSVKVYINSWIYVSLCLEPKVANLVYQGPSGDRPFLLKPQVLRRCINAIRPYHAVLLTEDEKILLDSLPLDASPALVKLIRVSSPTKNLQSLASEADIDLRQVLRLVASLVNWGKAMIIFPLCETNQYLVAPRTNAATNSCLAQRFQEQFPTLSLHLVLSEFSTSGSLKHHRDVLKLQQNLGQDVQVVVWLLIHRLIYQVHTFVHLVPKDTNAGKPKTQYRLQMPLVPRAGEEDDDNDDEEVDERVNSAPSNHASNRQQPVHFATKPRHKRSGGDLFAKFTAGERQSIFACAAAANEEDLLLLDRLSKYFNGLFHLEAIMFYENIRRSEIVKLIDKFSDVLFIREHDEADISYWIYD